LRNLSAPTRDAVTIFDQISNEKQAPIPKRLDRIKNKVLAAYQNYAANTNSLEVMTPIGLKGVQEKALLHAYGSATKSMKSLRSEIIFTEDEDFDECPYCGINEPATLDHYLPKEKFPEFSIYPLNLIPICNVCNSKYKGAKFLSPAGGMLFMHSYFDIFPDVDLLDVSVEINDKVELTFTNLSYPADGRFCSIFSNHFRELSLNTRYSIKAAAEINRKRRALNRIYLREGHFSGVAAELQRTADDLRDSLSGNHWKVALYDCLASSEEFCDGGFLKVVRRL